MYKNENLWNIEPYLLISTKSTGMREKSCFRKKKK